MSDVDFGDLLDFLALDSDTGTILLYAETITQARKFMSAGRIAARSKPVIVIKGGRSKSGAAAAASHTGALAGADAVYDAVFRRAGMLRVATLRELFDAAETLASGLHVSGDRLTIMTNGGGLGVLAADALEGAGGRLAELTPEAKARLDTVLPASWSHANPIDILGDAQGNRYESALDILADPRANDALLVMNRPTGAADSMDAAEATVRVKMLHPCRPIIGCWMGEASTAAPRALLSHSGIPNYETPDEAVTVFLHLAEYGRNQRILFETPSTDIRPAPNRRGEASKVIANAVAEGRSTLTEPEAKAIPAAYKIPTVATRTVRTPEEAGSAADAIGGTIALKILSRQITHKTDVGGVRLDLHGASATRLAAEDMLARFAAARPDAVIDSFTVQQMVKRQHAQELLLGAVIDPTFGPCLMFGQSRTPAAGTFDALCASYYQSPGFLARRPASKRTYRLIIDKWRAEHGRKRVAHLRRSDIAGFLSASMAASGPHAANSLLSKLKILLRFAVENGWRRDDPAATVRKVRAKSEGFATWSEEDIAAFEERWPSGTRQHLALSLLLYTGQRRGDVVRMGRQHLASVQLKRGRKPQRVIRVVQGKTGARLLVPLHKRLIAAIDAPPLSNMTFLVTEYGKPFNAAGFGNLFREWCDAAGLKGLSAHGLRKAASRRLAEAGCSANQIAAITGHATLSEVTRYTAAADQGSLASDAIGMLR